jgi:DNA polymerase
MGVRRLHLDYETKSDLNLKTVGAYKYAAHKSTGILMLGWAFDDEPESLWEPHLGPIPPRLLAGIKDSSINKHAFNAAFERLITRHCLDIEVPPEEWRCTMVEAFYLGFAGGLDKVLKAIGLVPKDARGGRLITMFCSPAGKNHKADWYDWENRPLEWHDFCGYCRQDVRVERQLWHWMQQFPVMDDWDYQQWFTDQRINDRGVPMDIAMAKAAIDVWDLEKQRITAQMQEDMGISKVTRAPFLEWIKHQTGVVLESTQKDYLASLLHKGVLPAEAKPLVELWVQKEGKATSKYNAVINGSGEDDRARGMFQYKGAARTDRVGGRLIQLQNLKKPIYGKTAQTIANVVAVIKTGDPAFMSMIYPDPVSSILGGSIRHALCAKKGKRLVVCDLTSIESVILGWVAQCPAIDDTFRQGRDSYRMFASIYYDIPYELVTKEQRSFSKPPVLGCGFMLGWKGLIAYAEGYGVDMTDEQAKSAVDTFRSMYPEIVKFWRWIIDAVKHTTATGAPIIGYRLAIVRDDHMLRIWLPSGRALSYYLPEIRRMEAPWSTVEKPAMIDNFTYMGMNDKNQWVRISAHAGGVTENVVQSLAGDVLWNGIQNATEAQLPVVLHVHDEIAAEVDTLQAPAALETLRECMIDRPHWCKDMWLGADGFITERFTKD